MDKIWSELVALEYILTQGYSDDFERDKSRLMELRFLRQRQLKLIRITTKLTNDRGNHNE
jgi:hypothetical protein